MIVSNEGRIDTALKIFQSDISPIVIFSTTRMPQTFPESAARKSDASLERSRFRRSRLDAATIAHANYEVRSVACEGGATLFRALLELDLVDQLNLTIAPYLFGGRDAPTLTGLSKNFLPAQRPLFA